jgi:cytochrome c556
MRLPFAFVSLLAFGLTACGNPDTPAGRAADARHENFEAIGDAAKAVADQLKEAKPDLAKIQTAAATINGFAPKVESWFPAGSGPADGIKTEALQAIWEKPAEFKAEIDKFVAEAAKFQALAQAGDVAAIGEGMKALGGSCKSCHDKFREAE